MLIARSPKEFMALSEGYEYAFGYIGEKTESEWQNSTSTKYMNRLWPGRFVYIPINVPLESQKTFLTELYALAKGRSNILGFNHTNPHKSNEVMKEAFQDREGDILIRADGSFETRDCNGKAGFSLLKRLINGRSFDSYTIAIAGGMGASGRLIALSFSEEPPKRMILIDPKHDEKIIKLVSDAIGKEAEWLEGMDKIQNLESSIAFVNATRHTGQRKGSSILETLKAYDSEENAALDLIMGGEEGLKDLKMPTANGMEYSLETNFLLSELISEAAGNLNKLTFSEFLSIAKA